jgi:hypothetical protein
MIGALLVATHAASADPCGSKLTFAPGRAALTSTTKHALDPLRAQLLASPKMHVKIVGPSDDLAQRRAEAAKWYLVDGGVEVDRIETSTVATTRDELQLHVVGGACKVMAPAPRPSPGLVAKSTSMVDDASELASLLAGGDPPTPIAVTAPPPPSRTGLSEQLPPPPAIHIGNDDVGFRGSEIALHVTTVPYDLRLASTTLATSVHHEETIERASLEEPGDTAEVEGDKVKLEPKQLRPLARCYRRALGLDPSISNRANLSFGIDKKGHVTGPIAISDTDQLDKCLHAAMKKWEFAAGKPMPPVWMTVTLRAR